MSRHNPNRSLLAAGLFGFGFLALVAGSRKLHQYVTLADSKQKQAAQQQILAAKRKAHLDGFLASKPTTIQQQSKRSNTALTLVALINGMTVLEDAVRKEEQRNPRNEAALKTAQHDLATARQLLEVTKEQLHFIDEYLAEQKALKQAETEAKQRAFHEKAKKRPLRQESQQPAPSPLRYLETEAMRQQKQQQAAAELAAAIPPPPSALGFLPYVAPKPSSPKAPQQRPWAPGDQMLPFQYEHEKKEESE